MVTVQCFACSDHLGENILFDWVEIARKALLEGTLETRAGDVLVDPVAQLEINSGMNFRTICLAKLKTHSNHVGIVNEAGRYHI